VSLNGSLCSQFLGRSTSKIYFLDILHVYSVYCTLVRRHRYDSVLAWSAKRDMNVHVSVRTNAVFQRLELTRGRS